MNTMTITLLLVITVLPLLIAGFIFVYQLVERVMKEIALSSKTQASNYRLKNGI